jgi:hypothetical protein
MDRADALFPRLIGPAFDQLPAALRAIHQRAGLHAYSGRCRVERGVGTLSRLCGAAAALPRAADDVAIRVEIDADARGETWSRYFGDRPMRSRLTAGAGLLHERLGPTTMSFALDAGREAIDWRLAGVRVLGIPMPLAWFAGVTARESLDGSRYRFDVRACLPVVGFLVAYSGTLDVGA